MDDLTIIKRKYGEGMMHLCRELFPTILDKKGVLSKILLDSFYPSREIIKDLLSNDLIYDFRNFILSKYNKLYNVLPSSYKTNKTPQELLDEAGYILYECKTNSEILKFKKYYQKKEEICTFKENRLFTHHVFFAVKKNVKEIKREDFSNPKRQDLYGTSVISIQFTKDDNHTLSIKNRYNHVVNNPDATFSNNLDNIIPGLTYSFSKHYGLNQLNPTYNFSIPNYILIKDKYYKYNLSVEETYYCPDNIVIINGEVKQLEKERYLFLDNSIINLAKHEFIHFQDDYLKELLGKIKKIEIRLLNEKKQVYIVNEKQEETFITLNSNNEIIALKNNYVKELPNDFLYYNKNLEVLELLNVERIGNNFLYHNNALKHLSIPKVKSIGNNFLYNNTCLESIDLEFVNKIGHNFIWLNKILNDVSLPNLVQVGDNFLYSNTSLRTLNLPNLLKFGSCFMISNTDLENVNIPKLGFNFLSKSKVFKKW